MTSHDVASAAQQGKQLLLGVAFTCVGIGLLWAWVQSRVNRW